MLIYPQSVRKIEYLLQGLTRDLSRRFAAFVYTPEGEAIREQLWKETMAEFEFAEIQKKLDGLKK